MAVLVPNINGHLQSQLTKSLDRILDEAHQSGELKLSNRKLKDFPKVQDKYNLSDTVVADLSKNRFSELPEEVTGFYFLEKLQCYHNAIRYIPDTVSSLQSLNFLDLSRNQLSSLPRELCQLPIQILLISNNRLTSLPDELSRMSHLTELDASCNQLTHLPPRLGELRSLQSLILRNNLLLAVPVEITHLKLTRLDLRANRIGILPIEMRDMTTMIDLLVEDNPLTNPPASLCKRGRVHIFKYLENEAIKFDRKGISSSSVTSGGTLSRRSRRNGASLSPGPPHLADRLKHKRQNVDSGYSTSSDCYEKRWSQEINVGDEKPWPSSTRSSEANGTNSTISTPSTISPAPEASFDDDTSKISYEDKMDNNSQKSTKSSLRFVISNNDNIASNGNGIEEKSKPLQQPQTYREYKEYLKQQRAHDVPSIYRTKDSDDQSYKTEPNTPTHQALPNHTMATSKSDPTPLNTVLSRNNLNGNEINKNGRYVQDYVKPKSPMKSSSGIMSHDNVPGNANVNGASSPGKSYLNGSTNGSCSPKSNGVNKNRNISWNQDVKMTFTMRREIDKAREETDLINQLRNIIESRLKMALPEDLAPALTDGVVLCHLANHIKPTSVVSIHVPSPAVPKLTMARCRRNVDNFIEACRKIGVDETLVCCAADVLEGKGLVQVAITVTELLKFHCPRSPLHATTLSTVV